jgi:hypothetical protein
MSLTSKSAGVAAGLLKNGLSGAIAPSAWYCAASGSGASKISKSVLWAVIATWYLSIMPCSGIFWKSTAMPVFWVNSGIVCSTQSYWGDPSAVHIVMLLAIGAVWAAAAPGAMTSATTRPSASTIGNRTPPRGSVSRPRALDCNIPNFSLANLDEAIQLDLVGHEARHLVEESRGRHPVCDAVVEREAQRAHMAHGQLLRMYDGTAEYTPTTEND